MKTSSLQWPEQTITNRLKHRGESKVPTNPGQNQTTNGGGKTEVTEKYYHQSFNQTPKGR